MALTELRVHYPTDLLSYRICIRERRSLQGPSMRPAEAVAAIGSEIVRQKIVQISGVSATVTRAP